MFRIRSAGCCYTQSRDARPALLKLVSGIWSAPNRPWRCYQPVPSKCGTCLQNYTASHSSDYGRCYENLEFHILVLTGISLDPLQDCLSARRSADVYAKKLSRRKSCHSTLDQLLCKGSTGMKMNKEQWWNDADRRKLKYRETHPFKSTLSTTRLR